jgi:hypothetical protein
LAYCCPSPNASILCFAAVAACWEVNSTYACLDEIVSKDYCAR